MDWRAWIPISASLLGLAGGAYAFVRSGGANEAKIEFRQDMVERHVNKIDDRVTKLEVVPERIRAIEEAQQGQAAACNRVANAVEELNRDLKEFLKEQVRIEQARNRGVKP